VTRRVVGKEFGNRREVRAVDSSNKIGYSLRTGNDYGQPMRAALWISCGRVEVEPMVVDREACHHDIGIAHEDDRIGEPGKKRRVRICRLDQVGGTLRRMADQGGFTDLHGWCLVFFCAARGPCQPFMCARALHGRLRMMVMRTARTLE
jgi:hypothetical protein